MTDKKCMVCRGTNADGMFESKCGHSVHTICLLSRPTRCGLCHHGIEYQCTVVKADSCTFIVEHYEYQFVNSPFIVRKNGEKIYVITPEIEEALISAGFGNAIEARKAAIRARALELLGSDEPFEEFDKNIFFRPSDDFKMVNAVYYDLLGAESFMFDTTRKEARLFSSKLDECGHIWSSDDGILDKFKGYLSMRRFVCDFPDAVSYDSPKFVYSISSDSDHRVIRLFYIDGKWVQKKLRMFFGFDFNYVRDDIPTNVKTELRKIIFDRLVEETDNCEAVMADFIIYRGLDGVGPIGFYYVAENCVVFDGLGNNSEKGSFEASKKISDVFTQAIAEYCAGKKMEMAEIEKRIDGYANNGDWGRVVECRLEFDEILVEMKKTREKMLSFVQ